MAGSPYGAPAGTIGPRGMDLSPYFQSWQLRQQQQQEEARRAQQSDQFSREMALSETAQKQSAKLSDIQLKRQADNDAYGKVQDLEAKQRYDQQRQDKLNEIQLREDKYKAAKGESAQIEAERKANLGYTSEARADIESFAAQYKASNPNATAEDIHSQMLQNISVLDRTPEQKAIAQQAADMWYKEQGPLQAKAEKAAAEEKEKAIVAADVEMTSQLSKLESNVKAYNKGAPLTQENIDQIVQGANELARQRYGDDPAKLKAAQDAILKWESGQYAREDIRARRDETVAKREATAKSKLVMDYSRIQNDLIEIEKALDIAGDPDVRARLETQRENLEKHLDELDKQMGFAS